ncbi:MAG TPA: acyl-CoA thioesterase, partial [Gemmatimonadaceae bacterium]|nr:acyl-CoA thioesterase [Gemmatimonadaceae bacterium]
MPTDVRCSARSTPPPRTTRPPGSPIFHTHRATLTGQRCSMRPSKSVRESQHETSELMMPEHANNMGHVFGGVILSMMDKCAAIAAFRHSRASVVTASIDRVDFR